MTSFVITPTHNWLEQNLPRCKDRFLVACPFVGDYLARASKNLPSRIDRLLLTRTDLRDFATGASDIDAVCKVAKLGAKVLSLPRLHAKVYVIDRVVALVTSANATHSGMRRNWECGVAIDNEAEVENLAALLFSGFGASEKPQPWTLPEIERLREPVRLFRESLPPSKPRLRTGWEEHPDITLPSQSWIALTAALPGWTRLTLEGVIGQPNEQFGIADVYRACLPMVAKRFPANKFPREKLRQQLQRLRDLGFIEFLGEGCYQRTVKSQPQV